MGKAGTWLAISVLSTAVLGAQAPAPHREFAAIEFVVGHCWTGTFADGKTTDTHCFRWQYGKHFVRDHHIVSSTPAYEGETLYSWDPAAKHIIFRYWSNGGLVLDGAVERDGDDIVFPSHYTNPDGSITELRVVWTRMGDDAYRTVESEKTADGWKLVMTVVYRRTTKLI